MCVYVRVCLCMHAYVCMYVCVCVLQAENKVLWGAFPSIASEICIVQNDNSDALLEMLQMCTGYFNIISYSYYQPLWSNP